MTEAPLFKGRFVDSYLSYLLARASFLVSREFHTQVERAGLQVPVWRVLASLSDSDGMIVTELAAITLLKQPTLTKLLDRMARDGLVERRGSSDDRRKTRIFLTPQGERQVADLLKLAKIQEQDLLQTLDETMLKETLRSLIRHCVDREAKPPRKAAE